MLMCVSRLSVSLTMVLALVGCKPSADEISAQVKSSMQESLGSDPRFKGLHLTVKSVVLVRSHDYAFDGMATVTTDQTTQDIAITVTADGSNTIWKTEPGALLPLIVASDEQNLNQTIQRGSSEQIPPMPSNSESVTDRALRTVKRDYIMKAGEPARAHNGYWSAWPGGGSDPNFVTVVVSYIPPSTGRPCKWVINFPVSAPGAVGENALDGCAKDLFTQVPVTPN
jgi:hypothetical protein